MFIYVALPVPDCAWRHCSRRLGTVKPANSGAGVEPLPAARHFAAQARPPDADGAARRASPPVSFTLPRESCRGGAFALVREASNRNRQSQRNGRSGPWRTTGSVGSRASSPISWRRATTAPSRKSSSRRRSFSTLRARTFAAACIVTSDASGAELCLRPEYTIPVCLDYLASAQAGRHRGLLLFRPRLPHPRRRGRANSIRRGSKASAAPTGKPPTPKSSPLRSKPPRGAAAPDLSVRFGDAGLFSRLLEALDLSAHLAAPHPPRPRPRPTLDSIFDAADKAARRRSFRRARGARRRRPQGRPRAGARIFFHRWHLLGGRTQRRPRSPSASSNRRRCGRRGLLAGKARRSSKAISPIAGDPDVAPRALRALAKDAGSRPCAPRSTLRRAPRLHRRARVRCRRTIAFAAAFARNLDYYTGFVFEAHDPRRSRREPVVGGGRYDGLLRTLGARPPFPRSAPPSGATGLPIPPRSKQNERRLTNGTLIVAVPSKGRLQENAFDFFARAGLKLTQGRGARDYRGALRESPASKSPFSRPPKSSRSSPAAMCISA